MESRLTAVLRTVPIPVRREASRLPSDELLLSIARRLAAAGDAHAEQPSTTSAEAVIAARLELQEAFIRAGWMPPRYRQEEMQRDREIVDASAGMFDERHDSATPPARAD